jgi:hypothetical protein
MHAIIRRRRGAPFAALVAWATFCVLFVAPSDAHARTTILGGTIVDQTWTPAGSPYVVEGDIVVPAGSFLDIEPGTVVEIASMDGQAAGSDTSRVEITVDGTLNASGTPSQPITFSCASATAGSWYGLVIGASATSATIANASIEYAVDGMTIASPATVTVSDTQVRTVSGTGVVVSNGSPTFTNLTVATASIGISVTGSASPTFSNGAITDASGSGVSISPSSASTTTLSGFSISGSGTYGVNVATTTAATVTVNLTNDTITRNGSYGVYAYGPNSVTVSVRNAIITEQAYGVYRSTAAGSPLVTVDHTDVWANTTADYSSVSAGAGSLSSNPLFVGPSNLRLTSNSPARFASDTGSDIGALPYSGDPTPGLYGTLWVDTHRQLHLDVRAGTLRRRVRRSGHRAMRRRQCDRRRRLLGDVHDRGSRCGCRCRSRRR